MSDSAVAASISRHRILTWISAACIVASFFIYAWAALVVDRQQQNEFGPERSSIAAAASHDYYGAPLGMVYSGVFDVVVGQKVTLDEALAQAAQRSIPPGELKGSTTDGNGIGYILHATISMELFGPRMSSVVLGMLCLMAVSAIAFICRFRDARAAVVVLYFTALTVMLYTALVWNPTFRVLFPVGGAMDAFNNPSNISVGGIRYFSLVAILPAFHLWLEVIDRSKFSLRTHAWILLPLALQVIILILAILCRNSAGPLVGAIFVGWVVVGWRYRREPGTMARAFTKAALGAVVAVAFVGILLLSVSTTYASQGRFTETFWHRVFVSLGLSPSWPFGNLRQVYDCTANIPTGLVPGTEDQNGHCVFIVYAKKHNIPPEIFTTMTYSRTYDVALREAFFHILRLYPSEMFKIFFIYKPMLIPWSIRHSLYFRILGIPAPLTLLFFLNLINFLAFSITAPSLARFAGQIGAGTAALAAFSCIPYILVWALPHTSADLLLLCFFAVGLLAVLAIARLRDLAFPLAASREPAV